MNGGYDPESCFFSTQTHVMTEDLLNALDCSISVPDSPEWFTKLLTGVDYGEEFTVTAEQACWILEKAEESVEPNEFEDETEQDEYFQIIFNTFDDFTNFQRMDRSEDGTGNAV